MAPAEGKLAVAGIADLLRALLQGDGISPVLASNVRHSTGECSERASIVFVVEGYDQPGQYFDVGALTQCGYQLLAGDVRLTFEGVDQPATAIGANWQAWISGVGWKLEPHPCEGHTGMDASKDDSAF